MYSLIYVLILLFGVITADLIKVRNGLLNGTLAWSKNGKAYRQFYGIPYAEPPLGKLRFQPPVPAKSWNGTRYAGEIPPICVQRTTWFLINSPIMGEEDCLYLNVFTPNVSLSEKPPKIPVIVFIHGGSFEADSGVYYVPNYFMDRNIILVTINYRLGALGFLGMNNDYISGNYGLKDQALALIWIKENIVAFGGDSDQITLMGHSAGAASVHLHMFSPLSKGLFNKAIMQSGSAYMPWSLYDESEGMALAVAFAVNTGCFYNDPVMVLKCLQKVPAEVLVQASTRIYAWQFEPSVLFRPVVESSVKNHPFLPRKPTENTYQTKNIPWIIGMNSAEGANKAARYLANDGVLIKEVEKNRNFLLPIANLYHSSVDPEDVDNMTKKIVDYYFGKDAIGFETDLKIAEMLTDSCFMYPLVKTILSRDGLQYVYLYDHRGSYSYQNSANYTKDLGVDHGDEIPLLFREEELEAKWTPSDRNVSEILLNFWINFATDADPNGHHSGEKIWKPVRTRGIEYLHIKSDSVVMEKDFFKEKYNFWDSLPWGKKNI